MLLLLTKYKIKKMHKDLRLSSGKFLTIVILVIGIFFRFLNLDLKVYWPDETFTSMRIAGYTEKEAVENIYQGQVIWLEDLQKYQRLNSEKGIGDTIKGLAIEEPQHTPFYYSMVRLWAQLFGDSVAIIRSLSAWISLLALPCIYWLCIELFNSPVTGWVAIALLSISPFHVVYAQEARPYSLWTVAILLSSAALLRAIRQSKNIAGWGIYTATVIISLYSFLFSGLVIISHGIYIFAIERFRITKTVIAYLIASFIGLLTLVPWLYAVTTNISQTQTTTNWSAAKVSLFTLLTMWAGNFSRIFFDLGLGSKDPLTKFLPLIPVILAILLLIGYAIYFAIRQTPKPVWLFILILGGVTFLALVLPDLILGGRRSGVARYPIPCYLAIQLAVSHLIATRIIHHHQQKLWRIVLIALLTGGILSCTISSQAQVWWHKGPERTKYNPQIAQVVNQTAKPLIISDAKLDIVQSLGYLLEPKVQLQLVIEPNIPKIADNFSDIFLYRPSRTLRSGIEQAQGYKTEPAYQDSDIWLWKLSK
jgi:uncharacterized membrane protein